MAVIEPTGDPAAEVLSYRDLGAPVVFIPGQDHLQWWTQGVHRPEYQDSIPLSALDTFFEQRQRELSPLSIYRAKTRGRFEREYQLSFVDIGLVSLVESEIGCALSKLIERIVSEIRPEIRKSATQARGDRWLFQTVFWLVAAKILKDKQVPAFLDLDLAQIDDVFSRVARHYGAAPLRAESKEDSAALTYAARSISTFSNLSNVTSESLAYVYENALVSRETRVHLATHSTPGFLVDYMVWKLASQVEQIPEDERDVFEPACGHAAFLVAAMRVLRDLLPASRSPEEKRAYLRQRLHGMDLDSFALEIARLSLTLADIPNPDGWDLEEGDVFLGEALEKSARRATLLLMNPPYSRFSAEEKEHYRQRGVQPNHLDKATEMLWRTLPSLRPGAVFGFIAQQSILYANGASSLRKALSGDFEILEISVLPDHIFSASDAETAVVLGHRPARKENSKSFLIYNRVREPDAERFKSSYQVTTSLKVSQSKFALRSGYVMSLPDLEEIWIWLELFPRLTDIASIGQGLSYKGRKKIGNQQTIASHSFPQAVRGFVRIPPRLLIHEQPRESWMSLDPNVIERERSGAKGGLGQILVNYAPVSRGPWRLKAIIDEKGHPVTSRFLTVRPRSQACKLLFLWALCNSPIANAYVYTHSTKRDILTGVLREMPVPPITQSQVDRVTEAAQMYLQTVKGTPEGPFSGIVDDNLAKRRLLQMDAEVLRLYGLPPRLERQLLDLFNGIQRAGVPFEFDRYFPEDFEPCFSLYGYLSEDYSRSTAGNLAAHHENVTSPALLAAIRTAVEAFED
ncbi:MAG: N-6 DNA methylase [Thermoanaerobaculia bacterium]